MKSKPDMPVWEKMFISRFESVRASLRSLQLDVEREHQNAAPTTVKRMKFYHDIVSEAFAAMNRPKPIYESKEDKAARQMMSLSQEMDSRE